MCIYEERGIGSGLEVKLKEGKTSEEKEDEEVVDDDAKLM